MTNTRDRQKAVSAIRRIIAAAKELTDAERALKHPRKKARREQATRDANETGQGQKAQGADHD